MADTTPQIPPLPSGSSHSISRRRQWLVVLLLALAVAVAVVLIWLGGQQRASGGAVTNDQSADAAASRVFHPTRTQLRDLKISPVTLMTFRSERVTDGKIALNADKTTPVFSPYSGRVRKVLANLGDHVKQGQPLLAVEASEFAQGQSDLITAENSLKSARAQLALAHTNETRKHALYDAKGGSLQDWQQSQSDFVAAENNSRSAEAALTLVRNRLRIQGKTDAEIAALENPERMSAESFVLSPISGTVTDRQVGLGQYIQSGASNPVYTIGDLSTVWLVGNVREADAPLVRRGQTIEVRVMALPGEVFSAKLTYVSPSVDAITRRLSVRAAINNPEGLLKPEMFASFNVITGGDSAAPGVPASAVVYEGDTARVWVLGSGNSITLRQIRAGRTNRGFVEVVGGLAPGEQVVTSGSLFIDRAARVD
jgi:cobalt-zinc-cadmium efflux system membrane fusion protein